MTFSDLELSKEFVTSTLSGNKAEIIDRLGGNIIVWMSHKGICDREGFFVVTAVFFVSLYSETWELETHKGPPKSVLNSKVVSFLRLMSMY